MNQPEVQEGSFSSRAQADLNVCPATLHRYCGLVLSEGEDKGSEPWQCLQKIEVFMKPNSHVLYSLLNMLCSKPPSGKGEWSVAERTTFMEYHCNERI